MVMKVKVEVILLERKIHISHLYSVSCISLLNEDANRNIIKWRNIVNQKEHLVKDFLIDYKRK